MTRPILKLTSEQASCLLGVVFAAIEALRNTRVGDGDPLAFHADMAGAIEDAARGLIPEWDSLVAALDAGGDFGTYVMGSDPLFAFPEWDGKPVGGTSTRPPGYFSELKFDARLLLAFSGFWVTSLALGGKLPGVGVKFIVGTKGGLPRVLEMICDADGAEDIGKGFTAAARASRLDMKFGRRDS